MSFASNATTIIHDLLDTVGSFNPTDKYGLVLAFAVAALLAFFQLLFSGNDVAAPPPAPGGLPFVGHALAYKTDPGECLASLRRRTVRPSPYSLSVWGKKVYAFFHPGDLEELWEKEKEGSLRWEELDGDMLRKVYGVKEDDAKLLVPSNDDGDGGGGGGLLKEYAKLNGCMMNSVPADGGLFKSMIERFTGIHEAAVTELLRTIDEDENNDGGGEGIETDLLAWVSDYTVRTVSGVLWGERNPYEGLQSRTEKDWLVDSACHSDHEEVAKAFKAFYADPTETLGVESAEFALRRTSAANEVGLSVDGLARTDAALLNTAIRNARPVAFWCLYYLYSPDRTKLLSDIRSEIKSTSAIKLEGGRTIVDVGKVATSCRLLNSLWNEVLRFHHDVIYTRRIEKQQGDVSGFRSEGDDTTYTLRRGNDIVVPSSELMRDAWVWGEAAASSFDPYRFFVEEQNKEDENFELRKRAFKPFGGGERHCPGRGFAWVEVATLVATFVTTFDVEVILNKGGMKTKSDGSGMVTPVGECRVRIKRLMADGGGGKAVVATGERVYVQP